MINQDDLKHLQTLARLRLTPEEELQMASELNKILGYFEQLQELDTTGVQEMPRPIPLVNVFRDDVAGEMFSQQQALGVAVQQEEGFFKVPRVVE